MGLQSWLEQRNVSFAGWQKLFACERFLYQLPVGIFSTIHDGDGRAESTGFGSLPVSNLRVMLSVLLVSIERPPVTIACVFARTKMNGSTFYAGGLS